MELHLLFMRFWYTLTSYINAAWLELQVNKLRTFLSLLGITIGIFCIIAVLTVIDSMKNNISNEINSLGGDIVYVGRWPWMDEGGEYKWWEFWNRPSVGMEELKAVQNQVPSVSIAALCFPVNMPVKSGTEEADGLNIYGVTDGFDRMQNLDIEKGRYLSNSEIEAGAPSVVLGKKTLELLFAGNVNPVGKKLAIGGKQFTIVGQLKDMGTNNAGFNFDESLFVPYYALNGLVEYKSLSNEPLLLVKGNGKMPVTEMKYELDGVLRRVRKVKPQEGSNFAMNELSTIQERVGQMFQMLNMLGALIGGFSLIVGGFGIANIMFVSVKERTKFIGLKKAIGAKRIRILSEFLIESVLLSIVGGIIGLLLVLSLGFLLSWLADFPIVFSWYNVFIGISISAVIGLLSGLLPAYSASKLDPVVAIRSN